VGFLGGAQVDRFGNINSTVIGDYDRPKVRLPGSGGACEIAIHAKKIIMVLKQSPKSFPEKIDFVTSPGFIDEANSRSRFEFPGKGPSLIITDFGVYGFTKNTHEMILQEVYPGVAVRDVKANIGWDVKVSRRPKTTVPPTDEELRIIRQDLDPARIHLR
jgi:glutaconate CoA-transferase subunit B